MIFHEKEKNDNYGPAGNEPQYNFIEFIINENKIFHNEEYR